MTDYEKLSLHLLATIAGAQVRLLNCQKDGNNLCLSTNDLAAIEHQSHTNPADGWEITPGPELEPWLEYLLARDFTHFYEVETSNGGGTHEIKQRLAFSRSWRHGRQVLGG